MGYPLILSALVTAPMEPPPRGAFPFPPLPPAQRGRLAPLPHPHALLARMNAVYSAQLNERIAKLETTLAALRPGNDPLKELKIRAFEEDLKNCRNAL